MVGTYTSSEVIQVGEARGVCTLSVSLIRVSFCVKTFCDFFLRFFSLWSFDCVLFQKQTALLSVFFQCFCVSSGSEHFSIEIVEVIIKKKMITSFAKL